MGRPRMPDQEKFCKACGKPMVRKRFNNRLEDRKAFSKREYCDRDCMATGMEGVVKNPNPRNSRRQSTKEVKANCEICGRTGRLYVHHKDLNPMNNESENLQTLCGSCHRRSHSPNFAGTPEQRKECLYCSRPAMQRGLCWTHLTRFKRYGNPLAKKIKIGSEWHLNQANG